MATLQDYKLETLKGETAQLSDYSGKALLIVNTASKCGLTPQYEGLQALYTQYKDQGLEILGSRATNSRARSLAAVRRLRASVRLNYGVTFPLFSKTDVNGADAHPLFKQLTADAPFQGFDSTPGGQRFQSMFQPEQLESNDVKWNFTKFLIDRDGRIVKRL